MMKKNVMFCLATALLLGCSHSPKVCSPSGCVDVEVVSTTEAMRKGLSGRNNLKPGAGMLFVFPLEDHHRFWMKDMFFNIDMVWINRDKTIVDMIDHVPACTQADCPVYVPSHKALYVLELPAGYALSHGFIVGNRLEINT